MDKVAADALIVGAGPSGCGAAYDLARAGLKVLLLDKAAFPRMKPCGGGVTMKALKALRYSIAPVIKQQCFNFTAGYKLEKRRAFFSKYPTVAMTLRPELDLFCLEQCVNAGAAFHKITPIVDIKKSDSLWRVTTRDKVFEGAYLIGADGANSRVRDMLGLADHIKFGVALEACVPMNPSGFGMEFDFGYVDKGYAWVFPKQNHLNVGVYSLENVHNAKRRLQGFSEERLGVPIEEKILGHRMPYNGHRFTPSRDTVFLVGDAAGLIDPMLGEGIYNAIRSGQIAAEAILQIARGGKNEYPEKITEITRDLKSYWGHANRFYRNVPRGYKFLALRPVHYCLMKGFSLGWTVSDIQRKCPLLPFTKPKNYLIAN